MSKLKIFAMSIMAAAFISCGNVTEVQIKVKTGSDIDVSKYQKIAVLPFVIDDEQIKNGKKNLSEDEHDDEKSEKISFFLRRILFKSKKIDVMDTVKTNLIIAGESIDSSLLQDEERLTDIGGELGVDAFITGKYKFYGISEPRSMPVQRYSLQLQHYVTETITYFHKIHILSVQVFVIDARTGKTVLDKSYNPSTSEAHSLGTLIINEAFQGDRVFDKLVNMVVVDFAKLIAPHYELEKRLLVK